MTDQFDLFGTPENPANPIEARFWDFHAENPAIYRLFDKFTRAALARGHEHLSADMVMHRIRWETSIETSGDFKVNNNLCAYFALSYENLQHIKDVIDKGLIAFAPDEESEAVEELEAAQ